jgi:predicted protein tyrosine phosphatase
MSSAEILTLLLQILLFFLIMRLIFRTGPVGLVLRFVDNIAQIVNGAPLPRYSRITPQLYVGGQHRPRGWARLRALGITAVVNMRETQYDDRSLGIAPERYLHLPTRDGTAPTLEHLRAGIAFIEEEIASGGTVYVHCASGIHRAATMAAAYLMSTGLSLKEAVATIRKVRPFAGPIRSQRKRLEQLARELAE